MTINRDTSPRQRRLCGLEAVRFGRGPWCVNGVVHTHLQFVAAVCSHVRAAGVDFSVRGGWLVDTKRRKWSCAKCADCDEEGRRLGLDAALAHSASFKRWRVWASKLGCLHECANAGSDVL